MAIKLLFLWCLITFSTSLWATDTDAGEFRGETKAKIEILQKQNDQTNTKIDSLEKDVRDEYKTVTDRQNERIGDIESHFNIFLTILGILAALASYMTFKRSKEIAIKEVKDWLEKNSDSIKTNMSKFEKELEQLKEQAKDATDQHNSYLTQSKEKIDEIQKNMLQDDMNTSQQDTLPLSNDSFDKAITHILSKPQNTYNFNDWNALAFYSYQQSKFDDALYHWRKVIEANEVPSEVKAQTLFNIAITLKLLNRDEEEMTIYNDLITSFKQTNNPIIKEQVAKALFNLGVRLGQLNKVEQEIETYDQLFQEYSNEENSVYRELIIKALINKAVRLGQLNRHEEEVAIYNDFLEKYSNDSSDVMQINVAKILVLKGIHLSNLKQYNEAIKVYDELLQKDYKADNEFIQIHIVNALLNKGNCLQKLNKYYEAISLYDNLIQKYDIEKNDMLRERIVDAFVQKGFIFGKLKSYQNAIDAYKNAIALQPKNITAYTNLLEIQLIFFGELDLNTVEELHELCKNDKETLLKFNMLKIIQNSLKKEQFNEISTLKEEFSSTNFGGWGWEELDNWANSLEDTAVRERVIATIEQFKNWDMDSRSSRE